MASRTWHLLVDTTTAGGSANLGNANDAHAPIGLWAGYVYRHFAKYLADTSGMATITSATLHFRSTSQVHVGFGSGPTVRVHRLVESFVGSGGSEGTWSASANPHDSNQPAVTSTGTTTTSMTRSENTWDTLDVTAIAQAWLAGSSNFGIRLSVANEGNTGDTWEGYAQASSYDSYITVVYTPTGTTTHPPSATPLGPLVGDVADVSFAPGGGWASPRPKVTWGFSDPDAGDAQEAYQVVVYNDSAGAPGTVLYDSGKVTSSSTELDVPATFVEGSYYHWKVQVWDQTDAASAYTTTQRFRVRWGAAEYVADLGIPPLAWALTELSTAGNVVVEYNSSTNAADPGAGLGTWMADLALVTKQRYLRYRVWLLPAAGAAPSLFKIAFSYGSSTEPGPDNWNLSSHGVLDTATFVYGVRSLRIDAIGADERTYQQVTVLPETTYQLSGRIKQSVIGTNPFIALGSTPSDGELVSVPGSSTGTDWTEVSVEWHSGAATAVYVQCGASGTGSAWFDALKLEASAVVTPWQPSQVSAAAAIDSGGVKVDAVAGGTFRLLGAAGAPEDVVSLGDHGLVDGNDHPIGGSGPVFPPSVGVGDRYYRTDLRSTFVFDGVRWVSAELHYCVVPPWAATSMSASTAAANRVAVPMSMGGSDILLVDHIVRFYVIAGGSTLDASNKWVGVFGKVGSDNIQISVVVDNIASGADSVWRTTTDALNVLLGSGYFVFQSTWTKTGNPGDLIVFEAFTFRIVAV